jgi:hypothetical protein
MSRWVCLRCFESNDEAAPACAKCGLIRGASPAPGDQWTPPNAAASAPSSGMSTVLGLLARFWWVLAIVAVAVGGFIFNAQRGDSGEISRSGSMSVYDLRVGDCFDLNDANETETDDVTAKKCSESHQFEVFHIGTMGDGGYPSDAMLTDWLGANCVPAFGQYVGAPYQTSRFDIFSFQPTPDGWDSGDRTVLCAAFDPLESELTSAIKDRAE